MKILKAYIRADANEKIGSGHISRTRILAYSLSEAGFKVHFLCKEITDHLKNSIDAEGHRLSIISSDLEITDLLNKESDFSRILIIDSDTENYYSTDFQLTIRSTGCKLMFITFYSDYNFYADIVLNQNILALSQNYSILRETKLLRGPKYLIMDPRFDQLKSGVELKPFVEKDDVFMLAFGNADVEERLKVSFNALTRLRKKPDKIIVITGDRFKGTLNGNIHSSTPTEIYSFTENMPLMMSEVKYGINSGGLTVWEFGSLNALNIIIANSKREKISSDNLKNNNLAYYLGTVDDLSAEKLTGHLDNIMSDEAKNTEMVDKLAKEINTKGTELIIKEIIRLFNA